MDGDYFVKQAHEPIRIPAENPPGGYPEVAARIMGQFEAPGVERTETRGFVSGRRNFITRGGEGRRGRFVRPPRYRRPHERR